MYYLVVDNRWSFGHVVEVLGVVFLKNLFHADIVFRGLHDIFLSEVIFLCVQEFIIHIFFN